jgi:hypothetical protein
MDVTGRELSVTSEYDNSMDANLHILVAYYGQLAVTFLNVLKSLIFH